MRRLLLLAALLALPGCQSFVGNPFDGFGGFLADTTSFHTDPNRPAADSENMKRAMGEPANTAPLLPEPGNVWPGRPRPEPTMQDIARNPGAPNPEPPPAVHPQPRGSSTPPGSVQPGTVQPAAPTPPPAATPAAPLSAPLSARVIQTPQGMAIITDGANGVQQYTRPDGSTGRAIPNANGTLTLIGPGGAVQTVPAR